MKTSQSGLRALTLLEGDRLTAYQDSVGTWTIGVGHTAAAGPPAPVAGMTITAQEALDLLGRDITQYEAAVSKRLPNCPQHVYDGAVSFCYNLGPGNFAKASWPALWSAGSMVQAEAHLRQWDVAGGRHLAGLARRRAEEADIIFRDKYPGGIASPVVATLPLPPPDPNSEQVAKTEQHSWLRDLIAELFPSLANWIRTL